MLNIQKVISDTGLFEQSLALVLTTKFKTNNRTYAKSTKQTNWL